MRTRNTARVILIDEHDRVLLVKYHEQTPSDPKLTGPMSFWVPPCGGVHEGETFEAAIIREIAEETGIELAGDLPWIWTRDHELMHSGELKHFHERYFVSRIQAHATLHNSTDEPIIDMRWWALDDIARSGETFFPQGLAELLVPVLEGRPPASPIAI
ncbi:MAG: NUDIX hydrolase [Phycisphaerales bacterium]|mgnify:CR=1 FL=1